MPQVTQAKEIQTASKVMGSTDVPKLMKLLFLEHTHTTIPFPFGLFKVACHSSPTLSKLLVSRLRELS